MHIKLNHNLLYRNHNIVTNAMNCFYNLLLLVNQKHYIVS